MRYGISIYNYTHDYTELSTANPQNGGRLQTEPLEALNYRLQRDGFAVKGMPRHRPGILVLTLDGSAQTDAIAEVIDI